MDKNKESDKELKEKFKNEIKPSPEFELKVIKMVTSRKNNYYLKIYFIKWKKVIVTKSPTLLPLSNTASLPISVASSFL